MLGPSIFASAAIVFALALDDFVIANQLSLDATTQTVSMAIYSAARTAPTPAANAIGTLMLVTSTIVIVVAVVVFRRMERARAHRAHLPWGDAQPSSASRKMPTPSLK